jgi:hypothetical protein
MKLILIVAAIAGLIYLWWKNRQAVARLWNRLTPTVRKILIVALVVLVLFVGYFVIRGSVNARIARVEAKLAIAEQTAKEANSKFIEAKQLLESTIAQQVLITVAADKKLAALMTNNAKLDRDLAAERAKTKTMPNDALAVSLGTYIGAAEIYATAAGSFSLTRLGAENTRGIFLFGDVVSKKLLNSESAREQDAVKLSALATTLGSTTNALGTCEAARLTDKDVIDLLKKDVRLLKSKARWAWLKAGAPAIALGVAIGLLVQK